MLDGISHSKSGHISTKPTPGVESLKSDLCEKLPFHENRWMCLTQSMTAALCLEPVARLEVTIVKARDLIPNETSLIGSAPHPFVRVYVDDGRVKETAHVKNSRHPVWNSTIELDIAAGRSMVRFHLYDQDVADEEGKDLLKGNMNDVSVADKKNTSLHHSLGFVEVCVGDMPFDTEIEGWLELRFPAHLQGINVLRYQQHCRGREDVMHREEITRRSLSGTEGEAAIASQHEQLSMRRKTHSFSHVPNCARMMKSVRNRIAQHETTDSDGVTGSQQFNAGELLVRMKLVRIGQYESDVVFSHAIQPHFLWFNKVLHEEHLPELDVQEMFDDAMDIKYAVLDDFVLCFASYMWYLLSWQSRILSGLISIGLCLSCLKEDFLFVFSWGVLSVLLLLNRCEGQRRAMTTSGLNAPLNNKGFEMVACWNSIIQMEAFLFRVVIHKGGEVLSEKELREFVTRGFRNGVSSLTLEDVVSVLKEMDWVTFHSKDGEEIKIKPGSMVRIHERRRATVDKVLPVTPGTDLKRFTLHYDEVDGQDENTGETLYEDELTVRTVMPQIPKILLSGKVKQNIRKVGWQIDSGKRSNIMPALRLISDVLTWKTPVLTTLIVAYLVFRVTMALAKVVFPSSRFVTMSVWTMRNGGHIVVVAAVVASFILFAQPLNWLIPLIRMLGGWLVSKRQAPSIWAFYTPHQDLPSATQRPHGLAELGGPSDVELGGVDEDGSNAEGGSTAEAGDPLLRKPVAARRAWRPCAGRPPREGGE